MIDDRLYGEDAQERVIKSHQLIRREPQRTRIKSIIVLLIGEEEKGWMVSDVNNNILHADKSVWSGI